MEPGSLVKAIYDFHSGLEGELSLKSGDIIQVLGAVDKHWTVGNLRGEVGKFPSSFVMEVEAPAVEQGQELFLAVADFISDVAGDLCFGCGDLIVGLSLVDENWWHGRKEECTGIFPLSHVWKLDSSKLRSARNSATVDLWATVRQDMTAQLDDELSLAQGDVVHITKVIDRDWYWGECRGKEGKFPQRFVTLLSEDRAGNPPSDTSCAWSAVSPVVRETEVPASRDTNGDVGPPKLPRLPENGSTNVADDSGGGYDSLNSGIAPYARAKFPFSAQYPNELSFAEGDLVTLVRHVDDEWTEGELNGRVGLFPTDYVDVIVDCPESTTEVRDGEPASFGRALFDFPGGVEGDLPLKAGEVVVLTGRVNQDWYRARSRDGRTGICPVSFVEEMSRSPENATSEKKMGRYHSAPVCGDPRKTLPSTVDELSGGVEMNSLPDKISSAVVDGAAHLRRANTLTTSESAAFKREVANFHEAKTPQKTGPVPSRPPPPVPSANTASRVPSRAAPPVPFDRGEPDTASGDATAAGTSSEPARETGSEVAKVEENARRQEERRRKVREHRQCVITELLQTERDYIRDLQICYDTYLKDPSPSQGLEIDTVTLFGNLDEVIAVASQLLASIEAEAKKREEDQMIGNCFVNMAEELKEVYGHYCRNHDDVSGLWTKYMENPQISQYLQAGVEQMQRETNCFDLPSVLIKPVQRILKYPLLINELEKSTEEGHPDKRALLQATARMSDVATSINEFKRRKDLVFKYRKNSDASLSRRLAKLNLHSVLKKSSRFGMKLSSTLGFGPVVKDEEFDQAERDFHVLEKAIKTFLKDLGIFCDQLKEVVHVSLQLAESIGDFYQEMKNQAEVEQYRTVQRVICTEYWQQFSTAVERDVVAVLKQVLQTFGGPNKLITKREHKLLDYAACRSRLEKNKDPSKQKTLTEEEQMAKNTYGALNSQLLDELPKLCSISADILETCVQDFLHARKMFVGRTTRELLSLMELPLMLSAKGNDDVLENFRVKHNLVLKTLAQEPLLGDHNFFASLLSKAGGGTLPRKKGGNKRTSLGAPAATGIQAPQSESQKVFVRSSYPQDSLYLVSEDYFAADLLDVSLRKGEVVGVIKRQDPMGSAFRWFVDNGASKGFVPAKFLSPLPTPHGSREPVATSCLAVPTNTRSSRSPSPNVLDGGRTLQTPYNEPPPAYSEKDPLLSPSRAAPDDSRLPAAPMPSTPAAPTQRYSNESWQPNSKSDINTYNYTFRSGAANRIEPSIGSPIKEAASTKQYENCEFDPLTSSSATSEGPTGRDGNLNGASSIAGDRYANLMLDVVQPSVQPVPVHEYYYAVYPFSASGPHQLSAAQGQVVLVLHKCDLHGNPEWWFVQDRHGNKGYVPGNYLHKYS